MPLTINDYPDYLAPDITSLQHMLPNGLVTGIDYDEESRS